MTFETFDQSDEETWPNQQKHKVKDNDKDDVEVQEWEFAGLSPSVVEKVQP